MSPEDTVECKMGNMYDRHAINIPTKLQGARAERWLETGKEAPGCGEWSEGGMSRCADPVAGAIQLQAGAVGAASGCRQGGVIPPGADAECQLPQPREAEDS